MRNMTANDFRELLKPENTADFVLYFIMKVFILIYFFTEYFHVN